MEEQEGKKKEHLVAYSVRLKRDQAEFLKTLEDAAAFIREALDAAILASSAKSKEHEVVLLNRRIIQLQKQIERIREGEEYKDITAQLNSDDMLNFSQALLEYEALAPLRRDMENLKAELEVDKASQIFGFEAKPIMKPRFDVYHPSDPMRRIRIEDAATPEEALQKAKQKIDDDAWRIDDILERDPSMKNEYEFLEKTKKSYDEEIARLEKEVQELKNKVIEMQ